MQARSFAKTVTVKFIPLLLLLLSFSPGAYSQKAKVDSMSALLATEKVDTNRVILMWQIARDMNVYNPDSALLIAQQALFLSKNIDYLEGESRSLGILANCLRTIGNYPKALELNIKKLQLEEKRNTPRNLGSVLMNIGIVYVMQEEYRKALEYYNKADSVIRLHDIKTLKYKIVLNIGDVYNRLNVSDSAYVFFNKSLEIAKEENDIDEIGTSLTGLGHSFKKIGSYQQAQSSYQNAINYLRSANDDEVLCEATLGLADLYQLLNKNDSAGYYATLSFNIAKNDGFLSPQLDASSFLTEHYKKIKDVDSAFLYMNYVQQLNDSVNSKSRVRESQIISSNEQYRQIEIEENRRLAKKERYQQLQMLLIAIFIPGFFLLTLLLNRVKLHIRLIRLLGVLSLLFFFEYLTLLLHPTVANLTHHTPVYEILVFVALASILIPLHHKLEHWIIQKLIHHRTHNKPAEQKNENDDDDKIKSPA